MFESVDARTDARTPARVPSYKLTLSAFGSGELINNIYKPIRPHRNPPFFSKPIRLNFETCMVFSVPVLNDGPV